MTTMRQGNAWVSGAPRRYAAPCTAHGHTTLYDLIASLREAFGPYDDVVVCVATRVLREGRAKFLNIPRQVVREAAPSSPANGSEEYGAITRLRNSNSSAQGSNVWEAQSRSS